MLIASLRAVKSLLLAIVAFTVTALNVPVPTEPFLPILSVIVPAALKVFIKA